MNSTRTRLKVCVGDLMLAIVKAKTKAAVEHQKAVTKYEAACVGWDAKVTAALRDMAKGKKHKTWSAYQDGHYQLVVALPIKASDAPHPPVKPNNTQYDRDLAFLSLSAEDTITISITDHFASYLI